MAMHHTAKVIPRYVAWDEYPLFEPPVWLRSVVMLSPYMPLRVDTLSTAFSTQSQIRQSERRGFGRLALQEVQSFHRLTQTATSGQHKV